MNKCVFINGNFVPEEDAALHYRDLSILRGYGVFDFFRLHRSAPLYLEEHLDRFYSSASTMHLDLVWSRTELKQIINELIQKNGLIDGGIRLTLTGGYSPDGYQISRPNFIVSHHTFQPPSAEQYEKGISLILHEHQRQLPQVKTIDYLMAIWMQPELKQKGADDILYHSNEKITECPRSNFFMVTKDKRLVTPAQGILHGITRREVLALSGKGFDMEERVVTWAEVRNASEVFITSSTKRILPVRQINDVSFGKHRPVTDQLSQLLRCREDEYIAGVVQGTGHSVKEIPQ